MGATELMPAVRDAATQKDAPAGNDDRLRQEAFEKAKQDALAVSKNGGIVLTPDIYNNMTRTSPWGPLPQPGDQQAPLPGGPSLPPPGDVLKNNPNIETTASKIGREALVIGGGVGQSFFYGIANLPDHLPQIGSGIVIGGTLAAMTKTGKLGAAAALVVGAYFTTRFILDTVNDTQRWETFSEAVKDTWESSANTRKNMHKVRNTLGNYTFDTSLAVASSYVGYKNPQLGEYILSILRVPPIVPNTPPPFNPALTSLAFATNIMPPSGFYRRYDDQTPFSYSSWEFDLHGSLRRRPGIITRTPDLLDGHHHHHDRNHYDDDRDRHERDRDGNRHDRDHDGDGSDQRKKH